ncbi:tRNA(Met) cytidine acetyltransferase TmcA [Billgrantia ethanolica]|nr:GNAT family N-acetyltransferase [Halomonas ethanolica]
MAAQGWRGLVWSTSPADTARQQALAVWQARAWQHPCWVSSAAPEKAWQAAWLPPAKARTRLGGEHDLIVYDAASEAGFDPDAFGALSGTLRAGGLLLLLLPPATGNQAVSHYMARLRERLVQATDAVHWTPGEPLRLPGPRPEPKPEADSGDPDCITRDQRQAVERLIGLRRRRPLVITADRGRGKSAALGIACARLLNEGQAKIWVTAPRLAAVEALFERLASLCPQGHRHGGRFDDEGGGRVEFVAPDELSARVERGEAGGQGSWLLVDEAAAIPAALLGQWLEAFPRIAFATTVHGYEGSGRGFALRFRERLERQTPDWRECHLAAPIRWAEGDPLERLVGDLLLLDAEPPGVASKPLQEWVWQPEALAGDEPALRQIFGLLVQAHYRTAPADLQRLLDAPELRVRTLTDGTHIQAVAVCADEGGFAPELADKVARGERRLPGHLLAQSLAAHAGCREALTARLRRVQRISVHPQRRREGLGARLLEGERAAAQEAGVDLLGASFGAEPGLLAFWRSQGFRTVRLGLSRETSTGEHAVMVVAPLTVMGQSLCATLTRRFHALLPVLLAFELAGLEPEVALALLAEGERAELDEAAWRDLDDVAHGHREPALARLALQRLICRAVVVGRHDPELAWLAAWAFQGRDIAWLAARAGVEGRRQVMARMRDLVATLLADESRAG